MTSSLSPRHAVCRYAAPKKRLFEACVEVTYGDARSSKLHRVVNMEVPSPTYPPTQPPYPSTQHPLPPTYPYSHPPTQLLTDPPTHPTAASVAVKINVVAHMLLSEPSFRTRAAKYTQHGEVGDMCRQTNLTCARVGAHTHVDTSLPSLLT